MLIPVFTAAGEMIDRIDLSRALSIGRAPNVSTRRRRGAIVAVIVRAIAADDSESRARREDSRVAHYEEHLEPAPMPMLKIIGADGSMRRWDDADFFNPRRFNPDVLPRLVTEAARS